MYPYFYLLSNYFFFSNWTFFVQRHTIANVLVISAAHLVSGTQSSIDSIFHVCFFCSISENLESRNLKRSKMRAIIGLVLLICILSFVECNDVTKSRQIRSPQKRGNLKLCNSAFVNFPRFKARGCPPPRFCKLSTPLKDRYCVKANAPASKRNSFYFPKN